VTAAPSVEGHPAASTPLAAAFGAGAILGGLAAAAALHSVGSIAGRPSPIFLASVAAVASLVDVAKPLKLPEVGFRIPRSWSRLGRRSSVGVFGAVLGFGLLTAVPAAGFYVLVLVSVAGSTWTASTAPFIGFALGRTVAFAVARGSQHSCSATTLTERVWMAGHQRLAPIWKVECAILPLLSLVFLFDAVGSRGPQG
jgi:hypothetical protein